MLTLGLSLPANAAGKPLKDGGAALVSDDTVLAAVTEERLTRVKHDAGFVHSMQYCLDAGGVSLRDIDRLVFSSCIDTADRDIRAILPAVPLEKKTYCPSHHLAHAYAAFFQSPFDQALVVILDSGGTILDGAPAPDWWNSSREQQSYFAARGNKLSLVGRDFEGPGEAGVGEIYRAVTKYLGWDSGTKAGNTMALSCLGDETRFQGNSMFYFEGDRMRSRVENTPLTPLKMLERYFNDFSISFPSPRKAGGEILDAHRDLAAFLQRETERALLRKVQGLLNRLGLRFVCIGGGVGLNCHLSSKILEGTSAEGVFVQPAAGDGGQSLGSAIYAQQLAGSRNLRRPLVSQYYGREYDLRPTAVEARLCALSRGRHDIRSPGNPSVEVAQRLGRGELVAWFQGRSEFGPRALGNRSILADPRRIKSKERLMQGVKRRESFMPFAPAVLEEHASRFFRNGILSPFMTFVDYVMPSRQDQIPAVVHGDGSARLQTVSKEQNLKFYALLSEFGKLTGTPLLLNTSLNVENEPICESIEDAFRCFEGTALDALVIGETIISKRRMGLPTGYSLSST